MRHSNLMTIILDSSSKPSPKKSDIELRGMQSSRLGWRQAHLSEHSRLSISGWLRPNDAKIFDVMR